MLAVTAMRIDLTLEASLIALLIGFVAYWSNPSRAINRLFLTLSVHVVFWLISVHMAVSSDNGQWWVRVASAIGAFVPVHLWLIKDASINIQDPIRKFLKEKYWLLAFPLFIAVLCFTEFYIPKYSSAENLLFGLGYYIYILIMIFIYIFLCRETILQIRIQTGLSRLELQILLLGGIAAAMVVIILMGLRAILDLSWFIGLQPLIVLGFYAGTVVAITTSRVFDARQILLVIMQKFFLITVAAIISYLLDRIFANFVPEPLAFFINTGLTLWTAALLNGSLDRAFHSYPQATAARRAAFSVARNEVKIENLENSFINVLKGWGQSEHALILSGFRDVIRGSGVELLGESIEVDSLRELKWATPERLARERSTPSRLEVGKFLKTHGLGIVVIGDGPTLTTIVGVGVAASRRPFTYPQVTQLLELTSIMESALDRAHFSIKAQHAEQLATVGLLGASLAHEIRNPLVSIKTFIHLLPTHHQDAAFRQKFFRLIGDEVGRIDRLTEQLLDLASPRVYLAESVELHPVLHASLDLVAAKAADKGVELRTQFNAFPDVAFTDASAAKQVILNLCFNAIQAVESWTGERWVKVSTVNTAIGLEISVGDSGPGIPPEIRPRLFQPFQSTKSTGFGLGLAICSDILANLNATISVDPPSIGCGATFRVTFPCRSLSS